MMSLRANIYSIKDFPKSLPSLELTEPTKKQISDDYSHICKYYKHPVFSSYIPTYDEMRTDYMGAINKRISEMSHKY
jgi:hypothetical protein